MYFLIETMLKKEADDRFSLTPPVTLELGYIVHGLKYVLFLMIFLRRNILLKTISILSSEKIRRNGCNNCFIPNFIHRYVILIIRVNVFYFVTMSQ